MWLLILLIFGRSYEKAYKKDVNENVMKFFYVLALLMICYNAINGISFYSL